MNHALLDSITEHFADLDDPRRQTANRRHEFVSTCSRSTGRS